MSLASVMRPHLQRTSTGRRLLLTAGLLTACLSAASHAATPPAPAHAHGADPAVTEVQTSAALKIHARRETVWALITSCKEVLEMAPGLAECQVLDTAPDGSWQLIREVVAYSWLIPKLTYVLRATYDYPGHILLERESGDLRNLKSSWYLEADGEFTVVRYSLDVTPGFWVPRWLMRLALNHDLPKMLRTLRSRAESAVEPATHE